MQDANVLLVESLLRNHFPLVKTLFFVQVSNMLREINHEQCMKKFLAGRKEHGKGKPLVLNQDWPAEAKSEIIDGLCYKACDIAAATMGDEKKIQGLYALYCHYLEE